MNTMQCVIVLNAIEYNRFGEMEDDHVIDLEKITFIIVL